MPRELRLLSSRLATTFLAMMPFSFILILAKVSSRA